MQHSNHGQGPYKNNLQQIRKPLMTQPELSGRLRNRGFRASVSYISMIESGLRRIPYDLAVAICEEVGKKPNQVTEIFLPSILTTSKESTGTDGN